MYGIDSKLKLGDQLKNFLTVLKIGGYDEIFNIDWFVE